MNQSKSITIEVLISLEWFTIQFDSDSKERNRLMSVKYNSFLLDTDEFPLTHPTYYKEIKKEMNKAAETYWNSQNETPANEQITGIPTLDYQGVLNNQMNMITKALGLAILILFTSFTTVFSQVHFDFGGGTAAVIQEQEAGDGAKVTGFSMVPVMKISAGYQFNNNIIAEALIQPSLTKKVNMPSYLGVKAGYNFNGVIPSVGYLYNCRSADDISLNGWEVGYALKFQFPVGDNGGIYAEGLYTKSSYQLTVGFNVLIQ